METLVQTLAVVATMANAVVYGTDVFSAIVQRLTSRTSTTRC